MPDIADKVVALHDQLIYAYDHANAYDHDDADDNEERDAYLDTLKQYTSTVALAASKAFAELVGIDSDNVEILQLTTEQYTKLEASGMLDVYIDGKEETDD